MLSGSLLALSSWAYGGAFPATPFSTKAGGMVGAPFLKNPPGARYEGMGPTSAAFAEGAESIFWNPAGLARLDAYSPSEASVGYNRLLETEYLGSAAYALPTQRGVFGFGLLYNSQSAQTAYDAVGSNIGSFRPYDVAVSGGYAGKLGIFMLGADVKLIRSVLEETSALALAMDAGAQALHVMDVGEGAMDAGLSLSNLGTSLKLGSFDAPLPFALRGGVLWHMAPQFNSALDVNLPIDDAPYVTAGVEGWIKLSAQRHWRGLMRVGYSQRNARGVDGFVGATMGGGLDLEPMRIDYAFTPYGDLGSTNRFTLGYKF